MHRDPSSGDNGMCGKKIATLVASSNSVITCFACDATTMLTGCSKGSIKVRREGFTYQAPPWSPPTVSCVLIFGGGTYGFSAYLRAKKTILRATVRVCEAPKCYFDVVLLGQGGP